MVLQRTGAELERAWMELKMTGEELERAGEELLWMFE